MMGGTVQRPWITQRWRGTMRQVRGGLGLVGLAIALAPPPVGAQPSEGIALPARVRVTAPALSLRRYVGQLSAVQGDTLAIDAWRVPLGLITQLEVSVGRPSMRRRIVVGLLAGAALGIVGSSIVCARCADARIVPMAGAVGASSGLLLGLYLGASRPERWRSLNVQPALPFPGSPDGGTIELASRLWSPDRVSQVSGVR